MFLSYHDIWVDVEIPAIGRNLNFGRKDCSNGQMAKNEQVSGDIGGLL